VTAITDWQIEWVYPYRHCAEKWSSPRGNRGMTMTDEIRELTDADLETVSGGWGISLFVPTTPGIQTQKQPDVMRQQIERQKIMSS
jgi:hypothetical protein